MFRTMLCLLAFLGLVGCVAVDVKNASDAEIAQARFVPGGPATITLYTVVSTRSGSGAHTGLLINGSERLMFDPAGSWYHPTVPERGDVHYGMTDRMISYYIDYHARETFSVIEQTVTVTPEVAEMVIARAKAYGSVPKGQCARSTTSILRGVPGFESIPSTWFPVQLSKAFGKLPGATTKLITDDDADQNHGVLMVQANGEPAL